MRWTNAGTELNNEIGRARTKLRGHRIDRCRHDAELRSFFSGMDETDRGPNRIDKVNRATVRNVNSEADSTLVRHDSVAVGETRVRGKRSVDDRDLFPVDLLRGDKWFFCEAMLGASLAMSAVQPG